PVPAVGQRDRQKRNTPRPVPLIYDRLPVFNIGPGTACLGERAINCVIGHTLALGTFDRHPEPEVPLRVCTAFTDGDMDLARQLAEDGTPPIIGYGLLPFDLCPF